MMLAQVSFGLVVVFLSTLSLTQADIWPGDDGFYDICVEIIDDVNGNSIPFRELVRSCTGWWSWRRCNYLQVRETLTRATLCNRLTAQHNTKNAPYIGRASVTSLECQSALLGPAIYGIPEWNNWSGRHCGTWRSTDSSGTVTQTFTDNAFWNTAVPSDSIPFVRQSVTFLTRAGTCCDNGWNESGGTVSRTNTVPPSYIIWIGYVFSPFRKL